MMSTYEIHLCSMYACAEPEGHFMEYSDQVCLHLDHNLSSESEILHSWYHLSAQNVLDFRF